MTVNAPRLVPETEVALLRHALRALLEATPAGSGLQAVARAQAEKALAAYDGRAELKPWVLTYDHRHGKDVSVVLSVDEPDGEAFYEDLDPPEADECITVESAAVSVLVPEEEQRETNPSPAMTTAALLAHNIAFHRGGRGYTEFHRRNGNRLGGFVGIAEYVAEHAEKFDALWRAAVAADPDIEGEWVDAILGYAERLLEEPVPARAGDVFEQVVRPDRRCGMESLAPAGRSGRER